MILKFAQGGASVAPLVDFNPVMTTNSSSPRTSTKEVESEQEGLLDDNISKLLDKLDGLPSDILAIKESLKRFRINQEYGRYDTNSVQSSYLDTLMSLIKIANFNRKLYENAFDILKSNGGLNEIAINEDGRILCQNSDKDIRLLTPEQIKENSEYVPLTNSELLDIRAYDMESAFNNKITNILQNGIGIESVNKMILDVISKLGETSKIEEGYISTDSKKILSGIKDFEEAVKESSGNFNPTLNNLYNYKIVDKNQAEQIQYALNYIYTVLPENAKSLLKYKANNIEGGISALLGQLISSQHNITNEFSLDLINSKGSNSSKDSKIGGIAEFKLDPVSLLQAGYGLKENITILTTSGGSRGILVPTVRMPIVTKEGKSIGTNATLADVSESGFAGYLNFENASMGGAMINTSGFNNIVINGTALYTGDLPVDLEEYYRTGNIKPDIDMLGRYKQAQLLIAELEITDKEEINKIYQLAGLPIMYGENGDILTNYARFGMINATALDSAFAESAEFADWLTEVNDDNTIQNVLGILNKGKSDADRLDFDAKSGWDSIMPVLNSHDSLYLGTIFIPVNEDHFTATSGFGNYPKAGEAEVIEINQQALERSNSAKNSYNNPGNQL